MKPKKMSNHKMIRKSIRFFFENQKTGLKEGKFCGKELTDFVNALVEKEHYPDTVLRYMRELKDEGVIDYERVGKKADSTYLITKAEYTKIT